MSDGRRLTPVREEDYELIEQAVMETSRGRWFLAEFARRNRSADTRILLDAIKRLERVVSAQTVEFVPTLESSNAIAKIRGLMRDTAADMSALLSQLDDSEDRLAARNDPMRAVDQLMKKQSQEMDGLVASLRLAHDEIAISDTTSAARRQVAQIIERLGSLSKGYHSAALAVRRGITFIGLLDHVLAKEHRAKPATDAAGGATLSDAVQAKPTDDRRPDPVVQVFGEKDVPPSAVVRPEIAPEGRIVIVRAPKGSITTLPGFDDDGIELESKPRTA